MKATTPMPLVGQAEERARAGLFAKDAVPLVLDNLSRDLTAVGVTAEQLLSHYGRAVDNPKRVDDAREAVHRVLAGDRDPDLLRPLVEVLYFSGHQRLLAKHHILFPAYNILDEYFSNTTAPWGPVVLPRPRVANRHWFLFGRRIGFPIGVPASVLTANARWIQYFASNGFNVLTYKTVRSRAHSPNQPPNWAFVPNLREPLPLIKDPFSRRFTVHANPSDWVDAGSRDVSTTNSFGVPSPEPHEWQADVENALNVLADDQLLIISVMGDDYEAFPSRRSVLISDYVTVARLAESAGADFIELNLSCPNSLDDTESTVKPPLCLDVDATSDIIQAVKSELRPSTRLIAKLAYLDAPRLSTLVGRIAKYVDGISGINTLQCDVLRNGDPTFPGRPQAGVSGIAIRKYALDFVKNLVRFRLESGEGFEILAMGGVTDPSSFEALYTAGGSAVQTASGSFANPFLAQECVEVLGERLPEVPPLSRRLEQSIGSAIVELVREYASVNAYVLAKLLPIPEGDTLRIISALEKAGRLERMTESGGTRYRVPA